MLTIVTFFKPTKTKLVFLVEWTLFILIIAGQGGLKTNHQVLAAGYPLVFFYLVACTIAFFSRCTRQLAQPWMLLVLAIGLTIVDQVVKMTVAASIPYQKSIPIVKNWLYLAHDRNFYGSWIVSAFNVQVVSVFTLMQWGLAIAFLFCSILCYRYYITINRQSLWADIALLGVFAGFSSWVCDMLFRGYIIDYIGLPGLVTADFKDILVAIGCAAFFAEILDNPKLSWGWAGWQKERDALIRLVKSFCGFSIQELHKVYQSIMDRFGKDTKKK